MSVPEKHTAGDTLEFPVSVPDYPPGDGWTLVYTLVPRFSTPVQAPITLTGVADPDDASGYIVGETANNSAAWKAGFYAWTRHVQRTVGGVFQRKTLDDAQSRGELEILANLVVQSQPFDNRSQAKKALDDAKAALAALPAAISAAGGSSVIEVTIADRTTKFATAEQAHSALDALVKYWAGEVDAEDARAEGRPVGPLGRVRYVAGMQ